MITGLEVTDNINNNSNGIILLEFVNSIIFKKEIDGEDNINKK